MAYYVNPFQLRIYTIVYSNFFADESESIIEMNDDNELSEQFDLALIETLGKSQILENLSLFKQTMPNYLAQLSKDNMKETENTVHKIKRVAA